MSNYKHYYPILRGKAGEFSALAHLDNAVLENLTPIIDVTRVPLKYPQLTPKEPLQVHLDKVVKKIQNSWKNDNPIIINLFDIDLAERLDKNLHPVKYFVDRLNSYDINHILTTGLDRDSEYNQEVINAQNDLICFRLLKEDLLLVKELNQELNEFFVRYKIDRKNVILLFDYRAIQAGDTDAINTQIVDVINNIDDISQYYEIIFSGTSFPENMSVYESESKNYQRRFEYLIWTNLIKHKDTIQRMPSYSDYGIVNPDAPELDPRTMNPTAKIRYTTGDDWMIVKGRSLRKHPLGYAQYHELAKEVIKDRNYSGEDFSWGDDYLSKCASNDAKSGNLQTWITVDTNHHLTFVTDQISNFPA